MLQSINLEFFMLLIFSWISSISNKLLSYENSVFGHFRNYLFLLIIIRKCIGILYLLFSWNYHLLVHFHLQCLHSEGKNGEVMKMKYISSIIKLNDLKYGWKQFTKSQVSKGCNPKKDTLRICLEAWHSTHLFCVHSYGQWW